VLTFKKRLLEMLPFWSFSKNTRRRCIGNDDDTLVTFQSSTAFEDFATIVCDDKRSATLDAGNVKLTYNALLEKAETKEKERVKEESRKMRKLENNFRAILGDDTSIDENTLWEDIRQKLEGEPAFESITQEYERMRIFKEFQRDLEETCTHSHSRKKSKKSKKSRKRSPSSSSESEEADQQPAVKSSKKSKKSKRYSDSDSSGGSDSENQSRHKSSSKKTPKVKKRYRNRSESRSPISSGSDLGSEPPPPSKKKKRGGSVKKPNSSPPPAASKQRDRSPGEASMEEGELSEEELEQRRRELLKELQQDA